MIFLQNRNEKSLYKTNNSGGTLTCYYDLFFESDMLTAKREDGAIIRFSRQEHMLLLCLVRHPHMLITRAELLEALGGKTSTMSERNIDYLVNRLRKRLGDTARNSRFIATQYGNGYVWIADPVKAKPLSAFLLIGPIFGWNEEQSAVSDFPHRLALAVKAATGGQQTVLSCPEWRPDPLRGDNLDFTLEVSIHMDEGCIQLALVLHDGRSHQLIESFRSAWPQEDSSNHIDRLAQAIASALWRHATLLDTGADAAVMKSDQMTNWCEAVAHLHRIHETENTDPKLLVMLALNHYARLIQSLGGIQQAPLSDDEWETLETAIENLALRALPDAHGDPQQLLAIAKLLRFIDRGYLDLAGRLTEEAFRNGTDFAAAFAMKGQIAASRGEMDTAVALYDKSIEMVEQASRFHIHLLILKIFALMAGEKRGAAYNAVVELHNIVPVNQVIFGLLFAPPKVRQLCSAAEQMFAAMTPETGRNLSNYLFRAWARQFQRYEHQQNVLRGLTCHLQRLHGNVAISSEIARRFPNLIVERNYSARFGTR
ncbi:helix-turn-helix domain-containing protein [Paracoccus onubensis]|uniref:winged helix-turn-helix domain-containing protein n=1 Tax=Paracoccus onubensis TaxID=1675788 RepID=UPI0027302D91|nr:helix-turn-helix domain-containing protein [Paracoccus onubensis]MDP0929969.1 helix-turn-helix domain-containing protein [Paracoccus onubensis]